MSNLYKQRYITNQQKDTRVINSNDLVMKKLEERAQALLQNEEAAGAVESEDGFTQGITAEPVEQIDYVAQAKEEAEQLLANAKEQANAILAHAAAEADKLQRQALTEGRELGLAQGSQEANDILTQEQERLNAREQQLLAEYEAKSQELEPELLATIVEVVEKVFKVQFHDKMEILLYLVNHTIESMDGAKEFVIRAGMRQAAYLEEHKQQIIEGVGQNTSVDIVPSHTMDEASCVIETENGVFECGMDVQLENLMKDIRSLCI